MREFFHGEGKAEMSTFSRSLPAWMRCRSRCSRPSQAIIAAAAPSCCRATAVPQAKHFPHRRGDYAEGCKSLHLTAKEAVSRNGLMKLRANGIRDFVWHVSQPQDGPEWVELGSTASL